MDLIKIRSLDIRIGEPDPKKGTQKAWMTMGVQSFGEKDHKGIIPTSLLDGEDSIVAVKTVKA